MCIRDRNYADQRRGEATEQDGKEQRQTLDTDVKVVGGVGSDCHEGSGTERNLPAETDQDIDAERSQRKDQEGNQDRAHQVFAVSYTHLYNPWHLRRHP